MSLSDYAATERAKSAVKEVILFGPARPEETALPPWEWRREIARPLLMLVQATWLLVWIGSFLRWRGYSFSFPLFAGGWVALEAIALLMTHAVIRSEERLGWVRTRLGLIVAIVVPVVLWWALMSGGLREFLAQLGGALRLRPGIGFWMFWMGIAGWVRGIAWAQAPITTENAQAELRFALGALALAALLFPSGGLVAALGIAWGAGWIAIALLRAASEGWAVAEHTPWAVAWRQAGLVAGVMLAATLAAQMVRWLLGPVRIAAMARWMQETFREPLQWLLLFLLDLVVFLITLVWRLVFGLFALVTKLLGIQFGTPPEVPVYPPAESTDVFLDWLASLFPPPVAFAIRVIFFFGLAAFTLLWLEDQLNRLYYKQGQKLPPPPEPTAKRRRLRWKRRVTRAPLPDDEVRRLYVRLLDLGSARGLPRPTDDTPYEHAEALSRLIPDRAREIRLITEEYVRVRYGNGTTSAHRLRDLRQAWSRVREVGQQ